MQNARDVAALHHGGDFAGTQHGGAEGEQSIVVTSFREAGGMADADGSRSSSGALGCPQTSDHSSAAAGAVQQHASPM